MIRVCEHCSNVNIQTVIDLVGEANVEVGCMAQCGQHSDETCVLIDDEVFTAPDEAQMVTVIQENSK